MRWEGFGEERKGQLGSSSWALSSCDHKPSSVKPRAGELDASGAGCESQSLEVQAQAAVFIKVYC
jgi:hypothetical protein